MAFWGARVRPGKPFTHKPKLGTGRLRITQATLDPGSHEILKCSVKCSVGGRRAVLLCTLVPNRIESMPLDLEFEEKEDVKFSVIGSIAVYLTGYYIAPIQEANADNDIESDAEDISETKSLRSDNASDNNYNYRDPFIDDSDVSEPEYDEHTIWKIGNAKRPRHH